MRLSDGTILMHTSSEPYDPVKAHEYYLRTRELKGRKKGSTISPPLGPPRPRKTSSTYTVSLQGKKFVLTKQQLAEQQAYVAKRVSNIKARLAELSAKLKTMMADARANEKPTAADKAKAARESKQYRRTHRQELSNKAKRARAKKTPVKKKQTVAELEQTIRQVKGRLKAVLETQRALATATQNVRPRQP